MPCAAEAPAAAGGERPLLVFAHGNSFPAASYRKLLALLRQRFDVVAPDRFGHDPAYPVSDSWPQLLAELRAFVRGVARGRPVVLVGHSLGGLLGLMLAERDPAALRSLVLLDSPLVAGWRAALLWGSKRSGLVWRVAPAAAARRRRERWPDLDAVREHFAAKDVFARWDPEMLADYAAAATEAHDGQRVLRFRRDVEARIYATLPHGLGRLLRRPPQLPIGFIGGTESRELRLAGTAATRRLVGAHLRWIEGTHLFPFEQPQRTAELIEQLWAELEAGRPADPGGDVSGTRNAPGCSL